MHRRLATQALQRKPDGVVDESLHIGGIELIERERLDLCSRGG
jgi:hypothetical protein